MGTALVMQNFLNKGVVIGDKLGPLQKYILDNNC